MPHSNAKKDVNKKKQGARHIGKKTNIPNLIGSGKKCCSNQKSISKTAIFKLVYLALLTILPDSAVQEIEKIQKLLKLYSKNITL